MRKEKLLYNQLVRMYYKCIRRRKNLALTNRNQRRQAILSKHIDRLYEKLMSLKTLVQKQTMAGAVAVGALLFTATESNAQAFGSVQVNPFSLLDIGSRSNPVFADLDDDGDMDMMVGSSVGEFYYFENGGTTTAPAFIPYLTNPFSLIDVGILSSPALADLDGDGDLDLLSGEKYGDFYYFENTGTSTAPAFGPVQINPFSIMNSGTYSSPVFADLDGDGDFDLISGLSSGSFSYYENTGTSTAPNFALFVTNPFFLTDVGDKSTPSFADFDGDLDLDLFSGAIDGNFNYFENTGTASSPIFAPVIINPFFLTGIGFASTPDLADLDGDGNLDLISGDGPGNVNYFSYCAALAAPVSTTPLVNLAICEGNSTTLTGTGNATLSWYDAPIAGTYLGSGGTFVTPALTGTTSYYLQDSTTCTYQRLQFTVTVNTPVDPTITIQQYSAAFGGVASSGTFYASGPNPPADAFDLDTVTTGWGNSGMSLPDYLEYDFGTGNAKIINGYAIYCASTMQGGWGSSDYDPSEWFFLGYNGTDWDTLDSRIDPSPTQDVWDNYYFSNTVAYEKYRFSFTNSVDGDYVIATEVKFFEAPGCTKLGFKANTNTPATVANFQWKLNGVNVGTNSTELVLSSYGFGDVLTCEVTSTCYLTTPTTTSNALTILSSLPDVSTTTSGNTITANLAGAISYQWVTCPTYAVASGTSTNQSYTATANGDYAVIINNGSCPDTSACVNITGIGIEESQLVEVGIVPNPASTQIMITANAEFTTVKITDVNGRLILAQENNGQNAMVNLSSFENGMYFIQLFKGESALSQTKKLVVNK